MIHTIYHISFILYKLIYSINYIYDIYTIYHIYNILNIQYMSVSAVMYYQVKSAISAVFLLNLSRIFAWYLLNTRTDIKYPPDKVQMPASFPFHQK